MGKCLARARIACLAQDGQRRDIAKTSASQQLAPAPGQMRRHRVRNHFPSEHKQMLIWGLLTAALHSWAISGMTRATRGRGYEAPVEVRQRATTCATTTKGQVERAQDGPRRRASARLRHRKNGLRPGGVFGIERAFASRKHVCSTARLTLLAPE